MDEQLKRPGMFTWNELMTTDVEAAKAFYSEVFGWEFQDAPIGVPYSLVQVDGQEVGGITVLPPEVQGSPPRWITYVTVDDVDAVAEKAERLGGKVVVAPQDVPVIGRYCAIQDPQGAMICAIKWA
jgi:predicted enzyme related to lactoylglutathione lyase